MMNIYTDLDVHSHEYLRKLQFQIKPTSIEAKYSPTLIHVEYLQTTLI